MTNPVSNHLANHSPLYNQVGFSLGDDFDDSDYDYLLHNAYSAAKREKDPDLEYLCVRTGMMVAKLHTLQGRVKSFLNNDMCWQQTLALFKSLGTGKHHQLCVFNNDASDCDCGLLAILEKENQDDSND